jgi:hypothetical protein
VVLESLLSNNKVCKSILSRLVCCNSYNGGFGSIRFSIYNLISQPTGNNGY